MFWFHLPFPGMKLYVLSHPDLIKHVLHDNRNNYKRSILYDRIRPVFGDGIITSEGESWKKSRRHLQPAFHSNRLAKIAKITANCTEELFKALELNPPSEGFDLIPSLMRLTLDIAVNTLFSANFTKSQHEEISQSIDVFQDHMVKSFWDLVRVPLVVPTPGNRKLIRAKKILDRVIYQMIQDRRKALGAHPSKSDPSKNGEQPYDDLLSLLIQPENGTQPQLNDKQIRDEVLTLLVAGHETTANALGWAFFLLSQHPMVLDKAKKELSAVLGGRSPTTDDLPRLKYVKWVFEESMRLYPPAYFFSRTPIQDDTVGKYKIKKGSLLYLSSWLVHRHPEFWENPTLFDPERFSPERGEGRHRFSYFPFGAGPHACIGASMAMTEGQIILAILLQRFDFIPLNSGDISPDPLLTLRVKPKLEFKLQAKR